MNGGAQKSSFMKILLGSLLLLAGMTSACNRAFEPIVYGKDACAHCKMTIIDKRFAAEIVNPKGKVFKFDDVSCLRAFTAEIPGSMIFVNAYREKGEQPLNAATAVYLHHPSFKSPMSGNITAFAGKDDAKGLQDSLQLELLTWETLP